MMRVLVLGADGFVGRAVADALRRTDWATAVEQKVSPHLERALEGVDSVANCVVGRPEDITQAARVLFAAVARAPRPIPVVHLGSMTVYGSATGAVEESSPLRADLGAYSQAQLEAEQLAARHGAIRLRPGCEYGPHCSHWTYAIARCLTQHRLGDLGAAGDGHCNLLFIDDLVAAVLQALRRPELRGSAFNLAMADPPTWNEYFIGFAKALAAVPVSRITRRQLKIETKLLAPPLKAAQMLLARVGASAAFVPPPLTPSLLRLCRQDIQLTVRHAEQTLGVSWTPLEIGLRRAAEWYRSQGRSRGERAIGAL